METVPQITSRTRDTRTRRSTASYSINASKRETEDPVLKIRFGPPIADFWSVWSSQKARKFQQNQPTT